MGRRGVPKDQRERRYIRIGDYNMWELIDEIAQADKYKKSFNRIINDALIFGLPLLRDSLCGKVGSVEEMTEVREKKEAERANGQIVSLLREIVLSQTLEKSMVASLFNAKAIECGGGRAKAKEFACGELSNTPSYLENLELRELAKLRE